MDVRFESRLVPFMTCVRVSTCLYLLVVVRILLLDLVGFVLIGLLTLLNRDKKRTRLYKPPGVPFTASDNTPTKTLHHIKIRIRISIITCTHKSKIQ